MGCGPSSRMIFTDCCCRHGIGSSDLWTSGRTVKTANKFTDTWGLPVTWGLTTYEKSYNARSERMFKRNAYAKLQSLNEELYGDLANIKVDVPSNEVNKYFLIIHSEELKYYDFKQIHAAKERLPNAILYFARNYKLADKYTKDLTSTKSLITVTRF